MTQSQRDSWRESDGELFRLLVENIQDYAIFVINPDGRVRSWNPGAQRLLGYHEDEIVGKSAEIFFTPEDIRAGVPQEEMREALEGGRANDDRWHVRKDGRRFWSGGMMTPLWDEDHQLRGFAKIMRDRTEWKLQEERARLHSKLLDAVGQALIATTPDGTIFYWNQYAEALYGWPRSEAIGRNILAVTVPQWESAEAEAIMRKLVAGESWSGEFVVQRRDGMAFLAEVTNAPLLDEHGRVTAVIGVSSDISDRKQFEELLRHSEERFRSLMEQAPFSVQILSPTGRTISVNRAWEELWGVRFEQLGDYNMLEDSQLQARGVLQFIQKAFAGEATRIPAIEYNPNDSLPDVTAQDDPRRWLSAVAYPLKDASGQVREVVLIHEDITARKRAEDELQRSERQSRAILESITDAFCALDHDGRFTYVNGQAEVLLARSRSELLGKCLWDESPEPLGKQVENDLRRAAADNVTVSLEDFYSPHDRWYDIRAYPSSQGLSIYFRDVSERKRAEVALRKSEQQFHQLADAMPQIVWTARCDGNIDYLNRRWTEFTGMPETAGNDAWSTILHPLDAAPAHRRWADSLRSGQPFEMEVRLFSRREQMYRWHLIRTVPVTDEAGNVVRWFGTSTDIHEQKRAEELSRFLAEASAALAGFVDYESALHKVANLAVPHFADLSAVDVADDGKLRRLAVAHQDPAKIELARELMQHYPPDRRSHIGTAAVLHTGEPQIVSDLNDELLVQFAQDERHLALLRSLALQSYIGVPLRVGGNTIGVLTFATSESGRKYTDADLAVAVDLAHRASVAIENNRLYQALRDADRRKDEFLATLAHELRNPLAPIRNSLQILKTPSVDAETAEKSRCVMERQVHHLVRLVDDLLDVSRVMRGKVELRKEQVDAATIVNRAVETVQWLIMAQGHELSVSLPRDPLPVFADPVRLAQVVSNLLTNAAKYTEAHGRIELSAERDGEHVVLSVGDNGIGIDRPMLPHVFELFVQADHATTRSQGGLGIGLTLVKNLVEMHEGTVEAHSKGLGCGSRFVVRLPHSTCEVPSEQNDRSMEPPAAASESTYAQRLLIVDDNRDAANSLAMLLRLKGHDVRVAYSGAAALELAQSYFPDVVFLDIGMPGMDGYEVARRMRQQPGLENVVLAALTGWGQTEDRRRTAEAGFNHHLVKPPELKMLDDLLAR